MTFTPHGKHLIAGTWVAGTDTFNSSPATGAAHAFAVGTAGDVDAACAAAEEAFWSYGYSSRDERAAFLNAIADEIEARAEAITQIREGRATTVGELTKSVAASRSSLYRSFDSVLGISPYAYMQRRRLVRLRRRLLDADGGPGTVTREAANLGAYHLGHLATSYRKLFGERPSDTAKRSVSTAPGNDPVHVLRAN